MKDNKIVDFVELMQLVKEGKAPKKIKFNSPNGITFSLYEDEKNINHMYYSNDYMSYLSQYDIEFNTKFEILDEDYDDFQKIDKIDYNEEGEVYIPKIDCYLRANLKERYLIFPAISKLIENQEKIIEKVNF